MTISIDWEPGSRLLRWQSDGVEVAKEFAVAPRTVTAWNSPPCVIVVEAVEGGQRTDNAVVFDPDGTERVRLRPPNIGEPHWHIGFDSVFDSNGQLIAVFATQTGDFWGVPDLTTGELENVAQWR